MSYHELNGTLEAKGVSFAIAVSRFNSFITEQLVKGALDCIARHGGSDEQVTVVRVPGANELPMVADKLAASGKFDVVIALGAVIRGATPHADLINSQVSKSLAQVAIAHGVPVINSVICADSIEQAVERAGTKAGNKGWDGAQAAMEMATLWKKL
ncbi:MAG: 6,7-dimethyl-8-ribityllumazine synthase [Kiritimatiellae bacterium]|jgi:6,7-dimethyl-8-ribityllumazine synthase|nr:6,7-dimethyl-8-ribityllumazine synthase [Kiritimatiellia bacterium]